MKVASVELWKSGSLSLPFRCSELLCLPHNRCHLGERNHYIFLVWCYYTIHERFALVFRSSMHYMHHNPYFDCSTISCEHSFWPTMKRNLLWNPTTTTVLSACIFTVKRISCNGHWNAGLQLLGFHWKSCVVDHHLLYQTCIILLFSYHKQYTPDFKAPNLTQLLV